MASDSTYTIDEVAELLRVSKLTVYDLVKKEELVAYRVGRQMRVDGKELERYKKQNATSRIPLERAEAGEQERAQVEPNDNQVVISGQDVVLDMLSKHIEKHTPFTSLRSYNGSLNSLIAMYNGECDVVSVHLFDGETGEYNLPYVKRVLVNHPFMLMNLVSRMAGIYVQPGNPLGITDWSDLARRDVTIVNREKGSGARVLLDEQLRKNGIVPDSLKGYDKEVTSHYSVASAVAGGQAGAGVGIENVAKMVDVEFIPLIKERYDLVILKQKENAQLLQTIKEAVNSEEYQSQLKQLKGYDLSLTGEVLYESL